MISGLATAGRKLFHPTKHLWLRARKETASVTGSGGSSGWLVDIGLSRRKIEDIGDVSAMVTLEKDESNRKWQVKAGEDVVKIHWDGLTITGADELYHTVYETYEETTTIQAPLGGLIVHVNKIDPTKEELDEDTILLQMRADMASLKQTVQGCMEAKEYEDYLDTLHPGRFQDA